MHTFARNFSMKFPRKIGERERERKFGGNFANNGAKIRARFDGWNRSSRFKRGGEGGDAFKRASGSVVYFEKAGYERQLTECSLIRM